MSQAFKNFAVLVLPRDARGALSGSPVARWLGRGDVGAGSPGDLLARLGAVLGVDVPERGRAALRFWGQAGRRPEHWIAAADPVYLEAHLDHLRLHALHPDEVADDLGDLLGELDATLGNDKDGLRFRLVEGRGYVEADREPFATSPSGPGTISGGEPSGHMPEGREAAGYHRLQSEIQMVMHGSAVADRRAAAGRRPLNGLWLWGGGWAPEPETRPLPALFGDAPLLAGYWASSGASARPWPGNLAGCFADDEAVVAVLPDDGHVTQHLEEARRLLTDGAVGRLVVMFAGGTTIRLRPAHRFRFWRQRDAFAPPGTSAS